MTHYFQDFQKIVDVTQSNADNSALVASLLPVIKNLTDVLKLEYNKAVTNKKTFTNVEVVQFESLADMLHVLVYNFVHKPTVNSPKVYADLVEAYSASENVFRSFAQYGRGMINNELGCFFASEQNLNELHSASLKMVDKHVVGKPVKFIQVS